MKLNVRFGSFEFHIEVGSLLGGLTFTASVVQIIIWVWLIIETLR